MVIYWTNRSAKLINLVMDKTHFLSQNSPSRRSELLGRKPAAFSGAFVSLPLLQFTEGWLQPWTFPCPRSLPTPRFAGGMWESLKPQNQEFGDRLFPVLPWICASAISSINSLRMLGPFSMKLLLTSDSVVLDSSCSIFYLSLSHYISCGGPKGKLYPLIYEI